MASSSQKRLACGVSIIICSYNGGQKLKTTLEHIAAQEIPPDCLAEIIYADNASKDNSVEIVRDIWTKIGPSYIPLTILHETKVGKYFALQTAIAHASYSYFIICDDDNWLAPDYVTKVYTVLRDDPKIGAVGGLSVAVFEDGDIAIPEWFSENTQRYAVGSQGDKSGDVSRRKQLWGAGMASRTELYHIFYERHPSAFLTAKETGHFVAEDTEYCLRLLLRGYKLYYNENLVLQHFVPKERLGFAYHKKLKERIADSSDIIERYNLATKLYGTTAYNSLNIVRLRLSTTILRFFTKTPKSKRRNEILDKLLFPTESEKDPVIEKILLFAKDPDLPRSTVR